jgi:ABC-type multidrug transport system fused ATPase/permease subunit
VVVYALYIRSIFKKKFIEAPIFAACGNIGWEFTWGFLFRTDMGPLLVWCYRFWFFFDLVIFWGVLTYGYEQVRTEAFRKVLRPLLVTIAVSHVAAFYSMGVSCLDTPIGATSAYLLNVYLSALYIFVLFQQRALGNLARVSWLIAWLKMIGTGMNTIFMNIHPEYAHNYFLRFTSIAVGVIDCVYIYLVWRLKRQARAASSMPASTRSAVSNPSVKPA